LTTAPTNAGSYTVIGTINDTNYKGSATNTLVIGQTTGTIVLGNLNQTYSGSAEVVTAATTPSGLAVNFTYNGLTTAPTNAGSYTVIGTINDTNYKGSATNTLVIGQTNGTIVLGNLNQTYSGSGVTATATTTPSGLAVSITYNGLTTAPTNAGSYTVIGTINDTNYKGSATNTLVINSAVVTPPLIVSSASGSLMTLSWPTNYIGWWLQVQTNSLKVGLWTNWVDLASSTATNTIKFTIDPKQPVVLFRLRQPTGN
jgi:hypothetical protein